MKSLINLTGQKNLEVLYMTRNMVPYYPGGYSHILPNGDVRLQWVAFLQEILKHGSRFLPKILKHGSTFLIEPKFMAFAWRKPRKSQNFWKNGPIFQEKSLKNGYLFLPQSPLKMGMGFEVEQHTPAQLKSEYPIPGPITQLLHWYTQRNDLRLYIKNQGNSHCLDFLSYPNEYGSTEKYRSWVVTNYWFEKCQRMRLS